MIANYINISHETQTKGVHNSLPLSYISKILSTPMSLNPRRNVTERKSEWKRKTLTACFNLTFSNGTSYDPMSPLLCTLAGLLQSLRKGLGGP